MTENERIAVLETRYDHLEEKLNDIDKKVDEMHAILLQARGVRWVLLGAAMLAGFLAGIIPKFWPLIAGK